MSAEYSAEHVIEPSMGAGVRKPADGAPPAQGPGVGRSTLPGTADLGCGEPILRCGAVESASTELGEAFVPHQTIFAVSEC